MSDDELRVNPMTELLIKIAFTLEGKAKAIGNRQPWKAWVIDTTEKMKGSVHALTNGHACLNTSWTAIHQ